MTDYSKLEEIVENNTDVILDKLTTLRNAMLWVALLLVAGCAGITPYDPPDSREDPPVNGLLTGKEGEFVIEFVIDRKTDNETGESSNSTSGSR